MEAIASAPRPRHQILGSTPIRVPAALLALCAFSAGTHIALSPKHLIESAPLGIGFLGAAGLLLIFGLGIFIRPHSARLPLLIALISVALIGAYVISRTVGLPVLHPDPEAVDRVGVITKAAELVALFLSLRLYRENAAGSRGWLTTRRTEQ
jgi:hypothetical protein